MSELPLDLSGNENGKRTPVSRPKRSGILFDWRDWQGGQFPMLEEHSSVKLQILRDYVELYVEILCRGIPHGSDVFKLAIVDGFSGGGLYKNGEAGSPFVIMRAIQVAEFKVNENREKKIKIDAHFYFVDEKKSACDCLRHQIQKSEFASELDKSIFVSQGKFQDKHPDLVAVAKKRFARGGRVIFFLDQCGYSQVKPATVRAISESLNHKAEFIINIAIDWFKDYLGDDEHFREIFHRMEIGDEPMLQKLLNFKKEGKVDWRYMVEAHIGPEYRKASGSDYWSPFYIKPTQGHRGYWLLHLAPQAAARHAMALVQWKHGNGFHHYGQPGLQMLKFEPKNGTEGYFDGWEFNAQTRQRSISDMVPQLTEKIWNNHKGGISVAELLKLNCNDTIADQPMFHEAIQLAAENKEIELKGKQGGAKRVSTVFGGDIISPNTQTYFFSKWRPTK
jgi:three-Cys-motif partner protein